MDWIEVSAKTVEAAKELALDRLGVVEDELEFEVLDEPRSGLFRRQDARIRARVKPVSREKPQDRRRRGRQERRGRDGQRRGGSRPQGDGEGRSSGGPEGEKKSAAGAPAGQGGNSGSSGNRRRRGGGGGNKGQGGAGRQQTEAKAPAAPEVTEVEMDGERMEIGEQADFAADFAGGLVAAMGLQASIRTEVDDTDIEVMVEGDELGVLVGPRGVTMQAIEEVTRAALSKHAGGNSARVHVDVAGYRQRRRAALADFARTVADEVVATGESRSLEPMNAADRKVVHDALSDLAGVETGSEGEEPRRRVVINPA